MQRNSGASLVRIAALTVSIMFPALTLVPLGSLWLWEKGFLLHWAVAVGFIIGAAYVWQRYLLSRPLASRSSATSPDVEVTSFDPAWSGVEKLAWGDVLELARSTEPAQLSSRDAALAVATRTIQVVARRLHPEVAEPVWQFTLPEALAIVERVSRRLGVFTLEHVPLSDRLTMARVLSIYRWRSAIDVVEKAYDVWRIIRLANPIAAATNEVRERLSREMIGWGRDHVMRQLSEAYIKEVGRAAIDLYGGRLQTARDLASNDSADHAGAAPVAKGPWRRLMGQTSNAGKALIRSVWRR